MIFFDFEKFSEISENFLNFSEKNAFEWGTNEANPQNLFLKNWMKRGWWGFRMRHKKSQAPLAHLWYALGRESEQIL